MPSLTNYPRRHAPGPTTAVVKDSWRQWRTEDGEILRPGIHQQEQAA